MAEAAPTDPAPADPTPADPSPVPIEPALAPVVVEEPAVVEDAAQSQSPKDPAEPIDSDAIDPAADDDQHEEDDDADDDEAREWDEGGKSHCGYGDSVHDTLMSIGETIHKVVGEPSEGMQGAMQSIGNWFQEASYAARDLKQGKMDVAEETAAAMKSVVSGDEEDVKEEGEGGVEGGGLSLESDAGAEGGEDTPKLSPVKEDEVKAGGDASLT